MKKKSIISLFLTAAIAVSAFGTVFADVKTGYFGSNNEVYVWNFDNTNSINELRVSGSSLITVPNYGHDLEEVAKDVKTYNVSGIFGKQGVSHSYKYRDDYYKFSGCTSFNVTGRCDELQLGNSFNYLKTMTFTKNTSDFTRIIFNGRTARTLPKISYDSYANTYEADYYIDCEKYNAASVTIPAQYGSDAHIDYSFYDNTALKSVTIEGGSKTAVLTCAFEDCKNLSSVTIKSGVTSIEYSAFAGCKNLTSIDIPVSVKTIRFNAFEDSGVRTINYEGTRAQWYGLVQQYDGSGPIAGANVLYLPNATIHCSDGDVLISYHADAPYYYRYSQAYLGWRNEDGKWYYDNGNGMYANCIMIIAGKPYGFASDGHMVTGWAQFYGKWYYSNKSGVIQTGWLKSGNDWYYLAGDGHMVTGWEKIDGVWYYFKESGAMVTGWQKIDGTWYLFNSSGAMQTGWYQEGNNWYYLKSNGSMATGWLDAGGRWYYFNTNGTMVTGWKMIGGIWYYFYPENGRMATGEVKIGDKYYYFTDDGAMVDG